MLSGCFPEIGVVVPAVAAGLGAIPDRPDPTSDPGPDANQPAGMGSDT
jgi:hypothetical protein